MIVLACATGAAARNAADDQLKTFTETSQRAALAGVVRSAGDACSAVTKTPYRGRDKQDHAYYAVRCKEGTEYQVQIKSDAGGSTSVLSCAVMKRLNTACWTKF